MQIIEQENVENCNKIFQCHDALIIMCLTNIMDKLFSSSKIHGRSKDFFRGRTRFENGQKNFARKLRKMQFIVMVVLFL